MKQRKPQPPDLWWSPTLGLITYTEARDGVFWQIEDGKTSLRHQGLPNEVPADARPLFIGIDNREPRVDWEARRLEIHALVMRHWIHGNREARRASLFDAQYATELHFAEAWLLSADQAMDRMGHGVESRNEMLRHLVTDRAVPRPSVLAATQRREEHAKRTKELERQLLNSHVMYRDPETGDVT